MARISTKPRRSESVALLRKELLALERAPLFHASPERPESAALENWANEGGQDAG